MTMACKICNHSKRLDIDRALVSGRSLASLSREFAVSPDSLRHHMQSHLSRQLVKSQELRTAMESGNLLHEIEDLLARSKHIMRRAERDGRLNLALNAIKETRGTLELMSRIAVTLHQIRAQELDERVRETEEVADLQHEGLKRLSTTELFMVIALQEKMEGKRDGDVIAEVLKTTHPTIIVETQEVSRTRRSHRVLEHEQWTDEREAEALEKEYSAEVELESFATLTAEPLSTLQHDKAGTWTRPDDPFPRRVVAGSIRTTIPGLSDS